MAETSLGYLSRENLSGAVGDAGLLTGLSHYRLWSVLENIVT
jgi:hypothetical protein